jgi:tRNA(Ile)-lysidine synthase
MPHGRVPAAADPSLRAGVLPGEVSQREFARRLNALGPFEPSPHLAVAVSGGADSLALAALAADWARTRNGRVSGLIVDHGLREAAATEAEHAAAVLRRLGIAPRILRIEGLAKGPRLAERARAARYDALTRGCAADGILHLLLGHHRADQAETLAMRRLSGSRAAGLAAMAGIVETAQTRLLRPLLDIPPGRLRATLRARGITWVEDPSNTDPASTRAGLRRAARDPDGSGEELAAAAGAAAAAGVARAAAERAAAQWLARHAEIRPEGYALLGAGPWHPQAFAALLRMLAGAAYAPPSDAVARLAAAPRAATLGGVRIMPAGRWRPGGWLLAREAAAMAPAVDARDGAIWDGRFRLIGKGAAGGVVGARAGVGGSCRSLPAAVLRTTPEVRSLLAVAEPAAALHLSTDVRIVFAPPCPAACAPFAPMQPGC